MLVTGDTSMTEHGEPTDSSADVLVGTEAVLHRAGRADVVAFLDLEGTVPFGDRRSSFHGLSDHVPIIGRFRAG